MYTNVTGAEICNFSPVRTELQRLKVEKLKQTPPILRIPKLISNENTKRQMIPNEPARILYSSQPLKISLKEIWDKILSVQLSSAKIFNGIYHDDWKIVPPWDSGYIEQNRKTDGEKTQLYIVEKENNIEYSLNRIFRFKHLLSQFPKSRDEIVKEAVRDIPPSLRGLIWAAILDIRGDPTFEYEKYVSISDSIDSRQIEVDIRRCHQVIPFNSSTTRYFQLQSLAKK